LSVELERYLGQDSQQMNDPLISSIILVVIIVLIFICVVTCPFPKCCQNPENKQDQRHSEPIVDANLFYVNSVYLPTEANVEIPLENQNTENINLNLSSESNSNLQVDFYMPPSYRDLYGN